MLADFAKEESSASSETEDDDSHHRRRHHHLRQGVGEDEEEEEGDEADEGEEIEDEKRGLLSSAGSVNSTDVANADVRLVRENAVRYLGKQRLRAHLKESCIMVSCGLLMAFTSFGTQLAFVHCA